MAAQLSAAAAARESALQWRPAPEAQNAQASSSRKEMTVELGERTETEKVSNIPGSESKETTGALPSSGNSPSAISRGPEFHLEGILVAAECPPNGEVRITLSINSVLMKFHVPDRKSVEVTSAGKSAPVDKPSCAAWKGQKAKVSFASAPPGGEYDGELSRIYFF